jgi:hypothetical protein
MSLTFPDNDNRENRMNQLVSDINSSIITQANSESEINSKITVLSTLAQNMLKKLEPGLDVPVDKISLYKTEWEVAKIVTPALVFSAAYKTLSKAVAAKMLSSAANAVEEGSEITGELVTEAAEELSIPTSAKLIAGAGGAVLSIGVGVLVDFVDGTKARDHLRAKIKEIVPLRITQKVNELKVTKLLEEIGSMVDAYEMMQNIGYTKEQMEKYVEQTVEKFKTELDSIKPDIAKADLGKLDKARGSWSKEG